MVYDLPIISAPEILCVNDASKYTGHGLETRKRTTGRYYGVVNHSSWNLHEVLAIVMILSCD